jgi:hypothetical protein
VFRVAEKGSSGARTRIERIFGTPKKSDSPVTISPPGQDHQEAKSRPPAMRAHFVSKLRVLGPSARDVLFAARSIRMNVKWPPDEGDGVTAARDRRSTVGSRCSLTAQYGGYALLAASGPIAAQPARTVRRELSPPSSISDALRPSSHHPIRSGRFHFLGSLHSDMALVVLPQFGSPARSQGRLQPQPPDCRRHPSQTKGAKLRFVSPAPSYLPVLPATTTLVKVHKPLRARLFGRAPSR